MNRVRDQHHDFLMSGITPESEQAKEVRTLCERASLSHVADDMIRRGLTPEQAKQELVDLMCVERGTMKSDDALNRPIAG